MTERPSEAETLKLAIAFLCIMEPDKRAKVLALAEKFARESQIVEGHVHFSLIELLPPP